MEARHEIIESIKQTLIDCNYQVTDCYVEEQTYSTDYVIDTDSISVVLMVNVYSHNDGLFDEIHIYTVNDNLFSVMYAELRNVNKMVALINSYIHSKLRCT